MSVQEAVPLEDNQFIARLFGPDVLGRLPTTGQDRIRRTALSLMGEPRSEFVSRDGTDEARLSV
jgi:hypothetical protein